jgi:DNA-binding MarR family transcriptional regulator
MDTINTSSIISLISHTHSDASAFLKLKLEELGLPDMVSSHGNILYHLSLVDKLPMSLLAQRINRDKSTTTVLVKKLESSGYVTRESSQEDKRVTYVKLSDKGHQYTDATAAISQQLVATCYEGFSEEEKRTVYILLSRIADNFCGKKN